MGRLRSATVIGALVITQSVLLLGMPTDQAVAGRKPHPHGKPHIESTLPFNISAPQMAQMMNGTGTTAPWNAFQGDPAFPAYTQISPTYVPGGSATSTNGVNEPNMAMFPGATNFPYPTGTVGTPGTLAGYCQNGTASTGNPQTVSVAGGAGSLVQAQPNNTTLPFSPAYFPIIQKNPAGGYLGYFDWRPKDTDEKVIVASSPDGKTWTYLNQALEQNPGYCPSADTTDDGQGHANVLTIGGNTFLYTLPRAPGDEQGVGMIVHKLSPTAANPLNGAPSTEAVGIDPDAFATNTARSPSRPGPAPCRSALRPPCPLSTPQRSPSPASASRTPAAS